MHPTRPPFKSSLRLLLGTLLGLAAAHSPAQLPPPGHGGQTLPQPPGMPAVPIPFSPVPPAARPGAPQAPQEVPYLLETVVRVEVKAAPADWSLDALKALRTLKARLGSVAWERAAINDAIKDTVKSSGLKMPQVAMPLRHIVTGRAQTPSIDAVLELLGRDTVLMRLGQYLESD